jgi:hypothetical protein
MLLYSMDIDILLGFLGSRYIGRVRMKRVKLCNNATKLFVFLDIRGGGMTSGEFYAATAHPRQLLINLQATTSTTQHKKHNKQNIRLDNLRSSIMLGYLLLPIHY